MQLRPQGVLSADLAYDLAGLYSLLGDKDQALAWMRRAVELGNHNYAWLQRDKNFNRLRNQPEFETILSEVRSHWERYRAQFGAQ